MYALLPYKYLQYAIALTVTLYPSKSALSQGRLT